MGRPRMIILIRHAQSEGNKNRDIHQSIPDHRVKLTPLGWTQAHAAGQKLRSLLEPSDTIQFFTSPYTRTRETTQGILSTLCSDSPSPSPFPLGSIKVYEEPRLREQDFGNFQPCSAEMERMWQERADYGHFFYRIPNGESAADAYDRVAGFNESLWRQFGEDDCASVCVLVTHGLMSRVFLMKWYHFSVEYFEDLRNVDHCEFLIMRKEESGKYNLETKLRTWSGLKRERALALKEKAENDAKEGKISKDTMPLSSPHLAEMATGPKPGDLPPACPASPAVPKRKKWGGCPNGCDHGRFHYKKENSMHNMKLNGSLSPTSIESPPIRRHFNPHFGSSSDEDEADPRGIPDGALPSTGKAPGMGKGKQVEERERESIDSQIAPPPAEKKPKRTGLERNIHALNLSDPRSTAPASPGLSSTDSSPRNPPQYVTRGGVKTSSQRADKASERMTHVGRDFGGSTSGRGSANSDTETDVDAEMARKAEKAVWRQKVRERREGKEGGWAGMAIGGMATPGPGRGGGARADGLGDIRPEEEESDAPCPESQGHDGDGEAQVSDWESEQEKEKERGRSLTERSQSPGQSLAGQGIKPFEIMEESSPGSVQEVHEAVVDLGIIDDMSEGAEHSAEEKDFQTCPVGGNTEENHGVDGQETERDREEKSVAGQVR